MSKNELRSSGKHRRCDFANGAGELSQCTGEWYETGGIECRKVLDRSFKSSI